MTTEKSISSPAYLEANGLSGHELRRVNLMNRNLKETREETLALGEKATNAVAHLITETRVLVLQMGKKEFALAAGLHPHAILNAERPDSFPQHESLSRIYRYLGMRASEKRIGKTICEILTVAQQKLLDLLIPEADKHGRSLRRTVEGLYMRWQYQMGEEKFTMASEETNNKRKPITYGTLWQRHESGVVPDFEEPRMIGIILDRDLKEVADIWSQQQTERLLSRGIPQPLVELMVQMQLQIKGLTMNGHSLREHAGLTTDTVDAILKGSMPKLESIQPALRRMKFRNDFAQSWSEAHEKETMQPGFSGEFERIRDANGWTNRMLSEFLEVQAPEQRDKKYVSMRQEVYRPSAEVRRMYRGVALSTQVPAKAAIALITDPRRQEQGKPQDKYLESLFLREVRERLRRQGSALEHSRLRHHRMLCGVTMGVLADLSGYKEESLHLIEQGKLPITSSEEERLILLMERHTGKKVESAHKELDRLNRNPTTVASTISVLAERLGGCIPLARALKTRDFKSILNLSVGTLKQIAKGTIVPSLPQLAHILERGGAVMTDQLNRDWYEKMPEYLRSGSDYQWTHPLARGFGIVILAHANSLHDFWQKNLEGDLSYPTMTRDFQQLNGGKIQMGWNSVARYLNAAGLSLDDPQRLYLGELFRKKDHITENLQSPGKVCAILQNVLHDWRTMVRSTQRNPAQFEHMLGLTTEELERRKIPHVVEHATPKRPQ